ncbi:MAG TPA: hypothetical protein VEV81_14105, partial [Pyrinomonadaceae bacterium]|nr:hypothetical protein [Pyrinomonadaceae bacterium]
MSQFPRSRFRPRRLRIESLQRFLAIVLSSLLFLTPLGFNVNAQQTSGTKSGANDRDYFMVYRDSNGDTVCRTATPQERLAMRNVDTSGLGLHQITHVKRSFDEQAHADNVQTGDNGTGGLTIILRATSQL